MTDQTAALPSFSLLIEPYNLRSTGLARLRACLDSIAGEIPSPAEANEALLLDEGGLPPEAVAELAAAYPWLRLQRIPSGLDYGDVKAVGVEACTGEVVVLLDSDCAYERGWLRHLLGPFADDPGCAVVTGETEMPISGPYSLAASLLWVFPRYSRQRTVAATRFYAHPAAIRRRALERCPLPRGLPLLRGQGVIHSLALRAAGYTIWRQPLAQTRHPVPPPRQLLGRFLAQGHDSVAMGRLSSDRSGESIRGFLVPLDRTVGRTRHLVARARAVLAEDRRRILLIPAALPIGAALVLAYLAGRLLTRFAPATADRVLGVRG